MAIVLLGERYTHLKALGGALAIVGTVGIVTGGGEDLTGSTFLGNALMVLTAFAYAMGGLIAKYLLRDMDPITLMATGTPFAVGALAVGAAFETDPLGSMAGASVKAWASVVFLALLATGLTMVLWYRVLDRVELSQLSYFVYLIPVVSVLFAWITLGETISLQQAAFAGLIIAGVAVAQRDAPQTAAAVVGATVLEPPPCEGGDGAGDQGPRG
jgi:O-acetylserine/cysteine efflux transporter